MLFVPASRPDMIAKVPRWSPDLTVVDLEDAVAADAKSLARVQGLHAAEAIRAATTVLVRVNASDSQWFRDDLAAVAACAVGGVVIPKYEHRDQLRAVRDVLPATAFVAVGIETARGVGASERLLAELGVDAAYFGAEDYSFDVGGRRTVGGAEVVYARSRVLLAARLASVAAIDQAVTDIADDEGFRADAAAGRNIGYDGKICVHPRQVALSHKVFAPTAEELVHANAVLEMAETTSVGVVDGQMTDEVHVRRARDVLARATRHREWQEEI